jgi:hypothetical protein
MCGPSAASSRVRAPRAGCDAVRAHLSTPSPPPPMRRAAGHQAPLPGRRLHPPAQVRWAACLRDSVPAGRRACGTACLRDGVPAGRRACGTACLRDSDSETAAAAPSVAPPPPPPPPPHHHRQADCGRAGQPQRGGHGLHQVLPRPRIHGQVRGGAGRGREGVSRTRSHARVCNAGKRASPRCRGPLCSPRPARWAWTCWTR